MTRKYAWLVLAGFGWILAAGSAALAGDDSQIRIAPRVEIRTSGSYLGVTLEEEVDYAEGGARVTMVVEGSPADDAGLESGDIIVGVGSRTVRGPGGLRRALADREAGDEVKLRVVRDGRKIDLNATLADRQAFSRTIGDGNWKELAEWGERFGEEFGEKFGKEFADGYEYRFENGFPHTWSEEQTVEFEERMEELRERLADIQIDIPKIEINGQNGFQNWFHCDEDDDCTHSRYRIGNRPVLGVQLVETTKELRTHLGADAETGVLVSRVVKDSVAESAGIEVGDLILRVGDEEIRSSTGLRHALGGLAGETVKIHLLRNGTRIDVDAVFPESDTESFFGPRAQLSPGSVPRRLSVARAPRLVSLPAPLSAPSPAPSPALRTLRISPAPPAAPRALGVWRSSADEVL